MSMCPICERRIPSRSMAQHRETCRPREPDGDDDAPPEREEKAALTSFDRGGMTWRVGMRVTTRVVLAAKSKTEYPAGSTGTVFRIVEDGVCLVLLDNEECKFRTVEAEPCDLVPSPHYLLPKTRCRVLPLTLTAGDEEMRIPHGTAALVKVHMQKERAYHMVFPKLRVEAAAPEHMVMPMPPKEKKPGLISRTLVKVGLKKEHPSGTSWAGESPTLLPLEPSPGTGDSSDGSFASMRYSCQNLVGSERRVAKEVSNLGVSPTYSSLATSPNSHRSKHHHELVNRSAHISPLCLPSKTPTTGRHATFADPGDASSTSVGPITTSLRSRARQLTLDKQIPSSASPQSLGTVDVDTPSPNSSDRSDRADDTLQDLMAPMADLVVKVPSPAAGSTSILIPSGSDSDQ
eukprot:TRINITY_DN25580_c0_g1_i1.p1 TRINITY_DN25580_c0_g1~~TRINITY_DN25580_c0_g1_i1.p1  ORF type:complete len:404 (+),score=123.71 TRINITY_DN25580_c0_g1_i1:87-1298(+)